MFTGHACSIPHASGRREGDQETTTGRWEDEGKKAGTGGGEREFLLLPLPCSSPLPLLLWCVGVGSVTPTNTQYQAGSFLPWSLQEVGASLGQLVSSRQQRVVQQLTRPWQPAPWVASLHVQLLPEPVWVFSRYSSSLPRSKNANIRLMEMVVLASGVRRDNTAQAREGRQPTSGLGLPSAPQRGLEHPRDGRRNSLLHRLWRHG